jgi:uncharacterized protein (TIGR02217 family)
MGIRNTEVEARLLVVPPGEKGNDQLERRVTQVTGNVVGMVAKPRRRVTTAYIQAMSHKGKVDATCVTMVYAQVMIPYVPNFEWIDMFVREIFPYDISYNSIGATKYATDVVLVDSGHDSRNSRWDQPLMEYDVAYGVRTMEHLQGLIAFFRAMKGRKYAFLYKDHVDHTSTLATRTEARSVPVITPFDQLIGVGDEVTKTFQLVKHYPTPTGLRTSRRPIYKPKEDTVQVALNGQVVDYWRVDYNTGKVTFLPRHSALNLTNMAMAATSVATQWKMRGRVDTFDGFQVGDKIVTTGWVNPRNNTSEAQTVRIVSMTADKSEITLQGPSVFGAAETSVDGVRVYVHPAPKPNVQITAGYEFFVPVRFDTDRLPVSLEYYGVGGAADVKLVEVRPHEE